MKLCRLIIPLLFLSCGYEQGNNGTAEALDELDTSQEIRALEASDLYQSFDEDKKIQIKKAVKEAIKDHRF